MKLKVEYMPIDQLTPYENNAKIHTEEQIGQIKASITEFGMNDPIAIWGKDNTIIEGHGRLMACKELGMAEVPVIRLDSLSDEQRRAYTLVHNQTTMSTGFDIDILNTELDNIDLDMSVFGFDIEIDPIDTEPSNDDAVPDDAETRCKYGDLWQLGDHRLLCGDATDLNDIKRLIGNQTVDLVLTDPPYGIQVVGENGKIGAGNLAQNREYLPVKGDDTTKTAEANYNIIKDLSKRQIIFGGNYFIGFLPFSDSWVIWDKRVDMVGNNFADGEMAWCSFHTPVRIYHQLWNGMIREGKNENRVHPTQKPVRMLSEILADFSHDEEVVCDCFGGSGSVLIACEQLGRKCLMMEYETLYCDIIIQRWETFTGKKAIKLGGAE